MNSAIYKIHLVNGKAIYIGIYSDDEDFDLLEVIKDLDKDGFFEWDCDDGKSIFIPVRNIMYIEALDMD